MTQFRAPAALCSAGFLAILVSAPGVVAEVHKCINPGGTFTYQSSPCAEAAGSASLHIDTERSSTSTAGADSAQQDYSIEGQARRMKAEREALSEQRRRARRQVEIEYGRPVRFDHEEDALRCARSREALLKWQHRTRLSEPGDLDPITAQRQIEHFESQVARYCN